MKINRKTLYIAALGYLWMGGTETILAQDATADSVKTGFFNAMDYVRQKRYIPAGRVIDPKARGWNSSLSIFAGAGKLGGGAAGPYSKEFGIAFTKDVTSFNSYRLAVEGAVNEQIGRGGVEIAHMFRILDYLRGYKDDLRWDLETVLGIGIYGTKNKVSKERFVAGGIHGGLHVNYHLHNHLDLFLEPRVNLFTDGINGLESQKRYDIGAQAMAGLTYRFTGLNKTSGPSANSGALDNLFYEIYAGIQGDYSARIRKAPIMNGVLEPVGPVMGISMGKWFLPFGIRGTLFAGVHNTLSEKGTEKIKEGYGGVRLEAMVNLNRLFGSKPDGRCGSRIRGTPGSDLRPQSQTFHRTDTRRTAGVCRKRPHRRIRAGTLEQEQLYAKFLARNEQQTPHAEPEHRNGGAVQKTRRMYYPSPIPV